ncbi:inosine 5-monophosphate dehydrogenase [Tessaracoccus lapidicaptus]|jgi:IMP dehydrogenase|uniref:Inosine 5-monophosphate dehydrogenase n=1 Tax=Tessaracoccus lapidicaptus TaxID=1427523 RepID=A0A1C0AQ28_9ACTN|nr:MULTISPECIES: GuaB3 family IMP dehydrogenase-related protein [Tessaracoccus]AQX15214.1 inosine 5-monophosphate dehydrogenase [Tessaracoccus sp. T2.5-30]OCL36474.1 inosine 5-monophosphate dehydrogenase [Tessaracoccus lapidicaptus]VEP39456.1 putative oxidoreductase/MSMEI_1564 [Tessaracoccus lapidicaptus]
MYELGRSKRASHAYSFDDVAIAPTRRTRGEDEVDLTWKIDAVSFDVPIVAAPMDSVMSPATAIRMGELGGLGVLNLEGLWTRYEDPQAQYEQITQQSDQVVATKRLQEIYAEPVKAELIRDRLAELRTAGVPVAGSLSPARTLEFAPVLEKAGMDFFVVRGTTVSAEHVGGEDTLNLKDFIYRFDVPVLVGGVATYRAALHLMRSGAAGVLVGFGGGATHTTASVLGIEVPMASAVADVAEARRDYLEESGGRYVHLIADGAVGRSGDIAKAIACGADAVMVGSPLARATEAPGRGWHWGSEAWHARLPRGERSFFEQVGTLEEVVLGPSRVPDGTMNLAGGLRKAMALTGYTDIKSFQRIDLILH